MLLSAAMQRWCDETHGLHGPHGAITREIDINENIRRDLDKHDRVASVVKNLRVNAGLLQIDDWVFCELLEELAREVRVVTGVIEHGEALKTRGDRLGRGDCCREVEMVGRRDAVVAVANLMRPMAGA